MRKKPGFSLLVIILSASIIFYSCQKTIDKLPASEEISTGANLSENRGVTPYKFERTNKHNFSSKGWREEQVNNINGVQLFSDESENMEIVCGPENSGDPRLIQGSITINLPTSADPTLRRILLHKGGYSGTLLADLTELKYSTYVIQNAPANFVLQVDVNGDESNDFNIFYDPRPEFQEDKSHPLELNKWQQWDALAGTWHINSPRVPIPESLIDGCSLAQLIEAFPNARVIDIPPVRGASEGIRFVIGGMPRSLFDNTVGYLDALIIGTKNEKHSTLYDFTCNQSNN